MVSVQIIMMKFLHLKLEILHLQTLTFSPCLKTIFGRRKISLVIWATT